MRVAFHAGNSRSTTALGTGAGAKLSVVCDLRRRQRRRGRNCGFNTFEQCLATISGIGGTCQQNTLYEPPGRSAPRKNWQQW